MQSLIDVPAPAKLNLFLHITGRRDDGYHLLQSAFMLIDWCDTLHFERLSSDHLEREDLTVPLPADDPDEGPVLADLLADRSEDPDKLYLRERLKEALISALTRLPAAQREVFMMHELEGISFKEMSVRLPMFNIP